MLEGKEGALQAGEVPGGSWGHGEGLCVGQGQSRGDFPVPVDGGGGLDGCRGTVLPACAHH